MITEAHIYAQLEHDGREAFAHGNLHYDPYLLDVEGDSRRGNSLILRYDSPTQQALTQVIDQLRQHEPEQYFYQADELHITLLSIITVQANVPIEQLRDPNFLAVFAPIFADVPPVTITLAGIVATPSAVISKGYAQADALNHLRETVRDALRAHGLSQYLDTRYRIQSAHSTLMRYKQPLRHPQAFLQAVEALREYPMGQCTIPSIQFVVNDWFMKHHKVEVLATYALG